MKVPAISLNGIFINPRVSKSKTDFEQNILLSKYGYISDLSGMPFVYPISFTSIQNSSKLRALFAYGLPCIYTGIPMIDSKQLSKMLKNQVFIRPSKEVIEILSKYEDSFIGMEARAFEVLKERAKIHPNKNISELLKEIEIFYRRDLFKRQSPIFYELGAEFKELPKEYQEKFKALMTDTNKKLSKQPVIIPFSSYEYKYKLAKIKEDILKGDDIKAKKVVNKLLKESKKLANTTDRGTIEHQKNVIGMSDWILRKSVLKDNMQLKELISQSKSRLSNTEIVVPFSRKAFLYDLARIIDGLENKQLQDKIMQVALKLPTSSEDFSAYMLKLASEPAEKVGSRIMWPSLASVEHLLPRSCGGADEMSNFGGATARANSARKSIDFMEQLKICPNTPKYCQMYVDRLIELYNDGTFRKHGVNPKYITDFKKTIYNLSNKTIDLDISKFYNAA